MGSLGPRRATTLSHLGSLTTRGAGPPCAGHWWAHQWHAGASHSDTFDCTVKAPNGHADESFPYERATPPLCATQRRSRLPSSEIVEPLPTAHHTAVSSVAVCLVSDEKGGDPLMKTPLPWWGNARFWLIVVVAELLLVAILAPDFYVSGFHLLLQVFQRELLSRARLSTVRPTFFAGYFVSLPSPNPSDFLSVTQQ